MIKTIIKFAAVVIICFFLIQIYLVFQGEIKKAAIISQIKQHEEELSGEQYLGVLSSLLIEYPDWKEIQDRFKAALARKAVLDLETKRKQEELQRSNEAGLQKLDRRVSNLEFQINQINKKLGLLSSRPLAGSKEPETIPAYGFYEREEVTLQDISQANKLLYAKKWTELKPIITGMKQRDPDNPYVQVLGAGVFFFENPQDEERQKQVTEVLQFQVKKIPEFPTPYYLLGEIYLVKGLLQSAQEQLSLAWNRGSDHPEIGYEYARLLSLQKSYDQAEMVMQKVWKARPGDFSSGSLYAGILRKEQKYPEAEALVAGWYDQDRKQYSVGWLLADLLFEEGKWKECLEIGQGLGDQELTFERCSVMVTAGSLAKDSKDLVSHGRKALEFLSPRNTDQVKKFSAIEAIVFSSLEDKQSWQEMRLFSKDVLEVLPGEAAACYYAGVSSLNLERSGEGIAYLRQVPVQSPLWKASRTLLLEVFAKIKDTKNLSGIVQEIRESSPDKDFIAQAEGYLK